MPTLKLDKPWAQGSYRNVPEDILTNHASGARKKAWRGMKKWSEEKKKSWIEEWKAHREEGGGVDFQHGADACGPVALGMVMNVVGLKIGFRKIVHAKHVLAYWPKGHPDDPNKRWSKMRHDYSADGQPNGKKKGKKYLRMDSANPSKLVRMGRHLAGKEKADQYEWIQKNGTKKKPVFQDQDEAFTFLKECIDGGYPMVVSYKGGPCGTAVKRAERGKKKRDIRQIGSGGHYIVVLGYDDEHIAIADPNCGKEEKVYKNHVLEAPRRFRVKGVKQDQDFDGGFMAAWERRGFPYLIIKPKDGTQPANKADAHEVEVDGQSVPKDAPLEEVEAKSTPVKLEDGGLKRVQQMLKYLSRKDGSGPYYEKKVDGLYGSGTKAAVKAFQADEGLDDDGIPGRLTKARLEEVWKEFEARADQEQIESEAGPFIGPPPPPPEILAGRWSTGYATLGQTVTIEIDTNGMPDGTLLEVEIWEADLLDADDFIKRVSGELRSGLARIAVALDQTDGELFEGSHQEFYFVAKARGQTKRFKSTLYVAT